jgi:hypothetical protein
MFESETPAHTTHAHTQSRALTNVHMAGIENCGPLPSIVPVALGARSETGGFTFTCNACTKIMINFSAKPVVLGHTWRCQQCDDFDLCPECYYKHQSGGLHEPHAAEHTFILLAENEEPLEKDVVSAIIGQEHALLVTAQVISSFFNFRPIRE